MVAIRGRVAPSVFSTTTSRIRRYRVPAIALARITMPAKVLKPGQKLDDIADLQHHLPNRLDRRRDIDHRDRRIVLVQNTPQQTRRRGIAVHAAVPGHRQPAQRRLRKNKLRARKRMLTVSLIQRGDRRRDRLVLRRNVTRSPTCTFSRSARAARSRPTDATASAACCAVHHVPATTLSPGGGASAVGGHVS